MIGTRMDKDVLIAEGVPGDVLDQPVVANLQAVREGTVLHMGEDFDTDFAAAPGFNSPLSLPKLLEIALPRLAAATDDDPSTKPARYPDG